MKTTKEDRQALRCAAKIIDKEILGAEYNVILQLIDDIDELEAQLAAKNKCGICLPEKPCNWERCPNDTVLAADYNALVLVSKHRESEIEVLRGSLTNRDADLKRADAKCAWQAEMLERAEKLFGRIFDGQNMKEPRAVYTWLSDLEKGPVGK